MDKEGKIKIAVECSDLLIKKHSLKIRSFVSVRSKKNVFSSNTSDFLNKEDIEALIKDELNGITLDYSTLNDVYYQICSDLVSK